MSFGNEINVVLDQTYKIYKVTPQLPIDWSTVQFMMKGEKITNKIPNEKILSNLSPINCLQNIKHL